MPHNHSPRIKRGIKLLTIISVALLALAGLLVLTQAHWRQVLQSWTGEEELREQLKGSVALALLKLTQPAPQTAPLTPMPYTGICPYGVNTFLEQEVEAQKIERSLQLLSETGFCWIRQEFPWEDIEITAKGDFWDHKWDVDAWTKYDRIVDLAEKYDVDIIARLDRPPAWSRAKGSQEGWTMAPPDNYADFGDFVYAVVSRYKGRIRYYQIWNEPNIFPEWGDQPADPEAYVELLRIAYQRAKQADPDCVIIAAALAQTTEETPLEFGPRNLSDLTYLEMMYDAGLAGNFDIMGAMVYGLWTGPTDQRTSRDRANYSRVQLLREIMVKHGDAAKPIWASEVGWNTQPVSITGSVPYGRVSEEQQARYAVQAYQRAARDWPWMGVMNYWFLRRPSDAEINQPWYYFRMLEPDFTPLPVFGALAELAQQPPQVMPGYYQEDHWALTYSGSWRLVRDDSAVLGTYQRGEPDAEMRFLFEGSDLAIVVRGSDAVIETRVDQHPVKIITLASSNEQENRIRLHHQLTSGVHTVTLRVISGEFHFDGLVVERVQRALWLWGALVALVVLFVIWAVVRHPRRARGNQS